MTDQAQAVDTSEDAILERIRGVVEPQERPRDDQGRFAKLQAQEAQEGPQEAPQEAPEGGERNAQVEGADAQEEEQEEVTWEQLKDIKLKIPMKAGDREWEEEIALEQLRNERMMQSDYQRKTQELAQQRNQVQEQLRQQVEQVRAQALQELQIYEDAMLQAVAPQLQGIDWNRLSQEDPAQWAHLRQIRDNVQQSLQAIRYQRHQIEQQQQAEQQQRVAQALQQANQTLSTELPGWGPELQRSLAKTAQAYGFADQELANVVDPRVIKVLHDAHKWRELQTQKPEVTKKVAQVPKVLKPGTKRNANEDTAREMGELKDRVRKTGGKDENTLQLLIRKRMFGR